MNSHAVLHTLCVVRPKLDKLRRVLADDPESVKLVAAALEALARLNGKHMVDDDSTSGRPAARTLGRRHWSATASASAKCRRCCTGRLARGSRPSDGGGYRERLPPDRAPPLQGARPDAAARGPPLRARITRQGGCSLYWRPSRSQPLESGCAPPCCLKKYGTPCTAHSSRSSRAQSGSKNRRCGPLSPPVMSQSGIAPTPMSS